MRQYFGVSNHLPALNEKQKYLLVSQKKYRVGYTSVNMGYSVVSIVYCLFKIKLLSNRYENYISNVKVKTNVLSLKQIDTFILQI